jgi:hypothetical protein
MIVTVRDPNILSNIDPKQLKTYLQTHGWLIENSDNISESIWVMSTSEQEHKEYDITLPLNPKIRSYALRMAEILEILEQVEGRSQLDILSDLVTIIPNTEIPGMVIKLGEQKHGVNVTIMGFVLGKPRQIDITLDQEEYNLARMAYNERLLVVCNGNLVKENDSFVFKQIFRFSLYDAVTERATA